MWSASIAPTSRTLKAPTARTRGIYFTQQVHTRFVQFAVYDRAVATFNSSHRLKGSCTSKRLLLVVGDHALFPCQVTYSSPGSVTSLMQRPHSLLLLSMSYSRSSHLPCALEQSTCRPMNHQGKIKLLPSRVFQLLFIQSEGWYWLPFCFLFQPIQNAH